MQRGKNLSIQAWKTAPDTFVPTIGIFDEGLTRGDVRHHITAYRPNVNVVLSTTYLLQKLHEQHVKLNSHDGSHVLANHEHVSRLLADGMQPNTVHEQHQYMFLLPRLFLVQECGPCGNLESVSTWQPS